MELTLGLSGGLLVIPEYTLPQNDEYLEEAAMEGEKEEEREKREEEETNHGWFFIKINGHLMEKT